MSRLMPRVSSEGWLRVRPHGVRRRVSHALRARVLERDEFACVACGATEELTVDHVRPVAYGGTNAVENLRTLCVRCNQRAMNEFLRRARLAAWLRSVPRAAATGRYG